MKKLLLLAVVLALILTPGCGSRPSYTVPAQYKDLYTALDTKLASLDGYLASKSYQSGKSITFAAELLPANGNRGANLLTNEAIEGVRLYLDRLYSLGIRGVKVNIAAPLLAPKFPDSDKYLLFYQKVADEIRKRGMEMLAGMGPLFTNPQISDIRITYLGIALKDFREGLRAQVERVINEVRPHYLTIVNEPSTLIMLTGLNFNVGEFTETVKFVLSGLDRKGVLLGAGAGNWNDVAYVKSLVNTDIDYIDIHVYPINLDFFDRAITLADLATSAGKRVIIGEAWLYKVVDDELAEAGELATQTEIFARDAPSFWAPLDIKYLKLITKLAKNKDIEFVSFFWSKFFFAYIDYSQIKKDMTYRDITNLTNTEAVRNMAGRRYSPTGLALKEIIEQGGRK